MKIFPNIRYDAADAMVQKPTTSIETVHPRMETLHQLDRATALASRVAVPATGIHVERGSAFVGPEWALGPPVVVLGFLGVSSELEGFEELASVGVMADLGKVLGYQSRRRIHGREVKNAFYFGDQGQPVELSRRLTATRRPATGAMRGLA